MDVEVPFAAVVGTGVVTVLLASALAYVLLNSRSSSGSAEAAPGSASSSVSADAEQVLDRSKYPGGRLYVYYATQTGTAESFARQLERESQGFLCQCIDMEDVTAVTELQSPCLVLAATYGEGEPTDNATAFVDLLKDAARLATIVPTHDDKQDDEAVEAVLQHVEFAVFGLGNRQYDHYNAMGKFFDRALRKLGAKPLLPIGLGDDDNDLEGDFETWKDEQLWPTLKNKYHVVVEAEAPPGESKKLPESPYVVEYHADKQGSQASLHTDWDMPQKEHVHGASRHYFDAVELSVDAVQELCHDQSGNKSTVHVELSSSSSAGKDQKKKNAPQQQASSLLSYQTADNLGVLPVNDAAHVESVAKSLNYDLDQWFSVRPRNNNNSNSQHASVLFPMPLTVRHLLTHYCDVTGAPRRSELKQLAPFATDKVDQAFLQRLSTDKAEYRSKIVDNYYGLVHLLEKCPSLSLPLDHFIDVCPRLQPRFFTIASSSSVHPQHIHLTVAVTKATRPVDQSTFRGVCSQYLASRQPQSPSGGGKRLLFGGNKPAKLSETSSNATTIRAFVRPSSFRLPPDPSKPLLLIGPGTGIAPMRALLQERQYQKTTLKQAVGANILYFGCQHESRDYLYRAELQAWQRDGTLDELHVAFSRQDAKQKVYVQHLLAQNAQATRDLLLQEQQGAYIYVCGGVQMGHDVQQALKAILYPDDETKAKELLEQWTRQGRYVQELWA